MRKLIVLCFAIVGFFALQSCSEEIKPNMDGKETAIIYAVINAHDSLHYFKINRALYGAGDMTQYAAIADSSYFDKVEATVKEYTNGQVTNTFYLRDTLLTTKDSGTFFYPAQKLYYFESKTLKTDANVVYKFEASINDGEFTVSGETSLVGDMIISQPTDNSQFSFATTNNGDVSYTSTFINYSPSDAKRVEVYLDVEFEEFDGANLLYTKSFVWKVNEVDQEDIKASMSASAAGETFYNLILSNVTNDPNITQRRLKGINIRILGANNDLQKYMLVSEPSSSLAQSKVTYTNFIASNDMRVIGIFGSRFDVNRYKPKYAVFSGLTLGCLNNPSMKELCTGNITGGLLFCSDNPADSDKIYYCN